MAVSVKVTGSSSIKVHEDGDSVGVNDQGILFVYGPTQAGFANTIAVYAPGGWTWAKTSTSPHDD